MRNSEKIEIEAKMEKIYGNRKELWALHGILQIGRERAVGVLQTMIYEVSLGQSFNGIEDEIKYIAKLFEPDELKMLVSAIGVKMAEDMAENGNSEAQAAIHDMKDKIDEIKASMPGL